MINLVSDKPHYENVPFEIPETWEWTTVKEVCSKIGSGSTPRGSNYSKEGIPFFRSQNIYNHGIVYEDIKYISPDIHNKMRNTEVRPNDLLLNITGGSLGRCAVVPSNFKIGNVSQHVCIMRPVLILPQYLHAFCLSFFFTQTMVVSGSGREGLPKYSLENMLLPLPPQTEQQRIIIEIERWFKLIDDLESNKEDLKDYIKQVKSKVLSLAISGKLVPQDPNDEPAIELLKCINPNFKPCDTSHYENLPHEIPLNWVWVKHNDVISVIGGAQPPKSNFRFTPQEGYIRLYQIRDYGKSPIPVYIPIEMAQKTTRQGDILLARYGASLGKVFIAEEGAYNVAMAKADLKCDNIIEKDFLYYYYLSDIYQTKLKSISRTAQAGFNATDLSELYFPIPPLPEQRLITKTIKKIFSTIDSISAEL